MWAARQHGQRGFTKLVAIKTILPHLARDLRVDRALIAGEIVAVEDDEAAVNRIDDAIDRLREASLATIKTLR